MENVGGFPCAATGNQEYIHLKTPRTRIRPLFPVSGFKHMDYYAHEAVVGFLISGKKSKINPTNITIFKEGGVLCGLLALSRYVLLLVDYETSIGTLL